MRLALGGACALSAATVRAETALGPTQAFKVLPRFVSIVKQGKNNKMPPWGDILSDDEIGDLWAFISSRRKP